ncbi:MAG TPA: hypothetical protein PK295_03140 [Candidatus Magasanikbacteria bacterium]|nr:hypothetical protein [Candidatus Magasanikbacteria bacterium]
MSEKFLPLERREHTRIANELDRLIIKLKATGQEVRHASLAALGRPVEGVMMRPEVFELSQKISEALQHGYTEAELAALIKELEEDENPEEELNQLVESLDITEVEMLMLESILREKKTGRLVKYNKNTNEEIADLVIDASHVENTREVADQLIFFLKMREGEDVEFKFFELE